MTRPVYARTFATALALTASATLAVPASAASGTKHERISAHHAQIRHQAYRAGYNRGYRAGRYAGNQEVLVTGRSAYVAPVVVVPAGYQGPLGNGGLLGTGLFHGDGVLGTGVFSGRGALGLGLLGF